MTADLPAKVNAHKTWHSSSSALSHDYQIRAVIAADISLLTHSRISSVVRTVFAPVTIDELYYRLSTLSGKRL